MTFYDFAPKPKDPYGELPGVQKAIKKGDLKKPANSKELTDEISEEALNSIPDKDEISLE